jgi:hypothetical protein
VYLVHLVLARCDLQGKDLLHMNNPNLRFLDLSHNLVDILNTSMLTELINVRTVILSHNPLTSVYSANSTLEHLALGHVDLSHTALSTFSSAHWRSVFSLRVLNLSYIATLHEIATDGMKHLPYLEEVDMSHSPIHSFPSDVFVQLSRLRKVSAENYKMCCHAVLPRHLDQHFCDSPVDEISSCDDLLRSELYRVFSWLICVLSVTGNVFCLVFRSCVQKNAVKTAFNLFVSSLCLADLFMGVYVGIIGTADAVSRGQYFVLEREWVSSVACKVAGFLSLLSSEVSALTVLLITLDRFIVLRFPFSTCRFGKTSACLVSIATWGIGLTLAAVPLLPMTSHWQFYSQTGICIPLPVTRKEFAGQGYSTGILVFTNFILFILIAAGQAFIYWSVQANTMTTDTTRKSHDLTVAKRLITVAVTDFLCWFPIGLCGILAWIGWPVPGEVSVAMAMLVLPINAALNPFLYTFNVVVEKRKKARLEKLLNKLKSGLDNANME